MFLLLKASLSGVHNTRVEISQKSYNYSPLTEDMYPMLFRRQVLMADVRKQKLSLMPGFRFTWHYSGMEVESEATFYNDTTRYPNTMAFIRNSSNNQ